MSKGKNKIPASVLNDLFSKKFETVTHREKIAEYGEEYIRRRLRGETDGEFPVPQGEDDATEDE